MDLAETTTTEMVDDLATAAVDLNDLGPDDYVLLPPDAEDDGAPILTEATTPNPALWRVAEWLEDNEESGVVKFDSPDNRWFELEVEGFTLIRLVLPGQEELHETWSW